MIARGTRDSFSNDASGNVYSGSPAIILMQRTYRNEQLLDDAGNAVLANFSDVLPMRRKVKVEASSETSR